QTGLHFMDKAGRNHERVLSPFWQQDGIVWVAPFVRKQEKNNYYWIPLWIPAVIHEGKLSLTDKTIPWLTPAHSDVLLGHSPFVEQIHCFDDWSRCEWLTAENTIAFETWQEVFEACQALFDELSNNQWQDRIASMEITLLAQTLVMTGMREFV